MRVRPSCFVWLFGCMAVASAATAAAQTTRSKSGLGSGGLGASAASETTDSAAKSTSDAPTNPNQIVVQRQRVRLRAPEKYQVSMQLEPIRTVRLAAPFSGTVKSIFHKTGEKIDSGTEVLRLDTTEKQLELDRAKALYKAAQLEVQLAASSATSPVAKELAEAKVQAAKAELDLAVYRVEQASIRAPFAAEIFRIEVSEGQVVRVGDTLATIGDTSLLKTELPIDRAATSVGQSLQVKIEDQSVAGKVQALLPLSTRCESLRDLLPGAATAIVVFENANGRLKAGQTVFSPLVPRDPVAEIPNSAIGNVPDGSHKVQVLRDNVVRDVRVATLAPVGADRSFISGPLDPADEVIVSSSQELADGTLVRPAKVPPPEETAKGTGSPATATAPSGPVSPTVKAKGL